MSKDQTMTDELTNHSGFLVQNGTSGAVTKHTISLLTLSDLDRWLASAESIPSNRRYERRAAIRSAAKWFGISADMVSLDPGELRKRFAALSPGGLNVSRKRISNAKSAVLAAIRAAGILPKQKY